MTVWWCNKGSWSFMLKNVAVDVHSRGDCVLSRFSSPLFFLPTSFHEFFCNWKTLSVVLHVFNVNIWTPCSSIVRFKTGFVRLHRRMSQTWVVCSIKLNSITAWALGPLRLQTKTSYYAQKKKRSRSVNCNACFRIIRIQGNEKEGSLLTLTKSRCRSSR